MDKVVSRFANFCKARAVSRARDYHATRRKLPARLTGMKTWETKAPRQLLRRGEARSIKIGKREKLGTAKSITTASSQNLSFFSLSSS
ncbi:unnamed protein product [Linum trigynum]|uniref:Uncharacterized protein n=1 Tax=Linum trigynum TaxID=586398 RepID=A0AAV2D4M9_9ROSI